MLKNTNTEPNYPNIIINESVNDYNINDVNELTSKIISAIKEVYDPEIPVDIYELGLIYTIEYYNLAKNLISLRIDMTLTAPGCPVAASMPEWVANTIKKIPQIETCDIQLVWEPYWTTDRMSMNAKLSLNLF